MSASQLVRSHAVIPTESAPVAPLNPIPTPYTVTLTDPDAPVLALTSALMPPAAEESAAEALPRRTPADMATRRLPPDACAACPRTDVSDSHDVCSPRDPTSLSCPENPTSPSPAPCTVTLRDPDEPRLARRMALNEAGTADTPMELLPTFRPTVTDTPRLCI